jgi:hypothetical protein
MTLIAIFTALVLLHSLISGRLERTLVTAPIVFTAAGMLALLILPELRTRWMHALYFAVMMTVLGSIFAHGLSAMPGMEAYARKIGTLPPGAPELEGLEAANGDVS